MTPNWYQIYLREIGADRSLEKDPHKVVKTLKMSLTNRLQIINVGWGALGKATNTRYSDWRRVFYSGWDDKMRNIVLGLIQSVEPVDFKEEDWL